MNQFQKNLIEGQYKVLRVIARIEKWRLYVALL
jgi:hypothetical protein